MTAAQHSRLVERVARALCSESGDNPDGILFESSVKNGMLIQTPYSQWHDFRDQAQAALEACRAEEMRSLLLRLEDCSLGDRTFDEEAVYGVWRDARALIAKLDEKL